MFHFYLFIALGMLALTAASGGISYGVGRALQKSAPSPPKPLPQYRKYGFGAGGTAAFQGSGSYINQLSSHDTLRFESAETGGATVTSNFGVKPRMLGDPSRASKQEYPENAGRKVDVLVNKYGRRKPLLPGGERPPEEFHGGPRSFLMLNQEDLALIWNRSGLDPRGFWDSNPRLERKFYAGTERDDELRARLNPLIERDETKPGAKRKRTYATFL